MHYPTNSQINLLVPSLSTSWNGVDRHKLEIALRSEDSKLVLPISNIYSFEFKVMAIYP